MSRCSKSEHPAKFARLGPVELLVTHLAFGETTNQKANNLKKLYQIFHDPMWLFLQDTLLIKMIIMVIIIAANADLTFIYLLL